MSRRLNALLLLPALAVLCAVAISCGSSGQAQVRFVHAIQDGAAMDIDITGPTDVVPTPVFSAISFLQVLPSQPGYTGVASGADKIEGFLTGTTNVGFNGVPINLSGSQAYTLVATGLVSPSKNAVILPIADNIPSPEISDVAFRVINASPSGPNGTGGAVDVYVLLNPASGPRGTPTFSGVAYQQATGYVGTPFNPNNDTTPPGFTVFVVPAGQSAPPYIVSEGINPSTGGAVRTIVLTDVQNGNAMSPRFLELSDLN
jgi:hypothetical protein